MSYRALKKQAQEFARLAKPHQPYYYVIAYEARQLKIPNPPKNPKKRRDLGYIGGELLLGVVVFHPPSLSSKFLAGADYPRWWGPHTADACYIQQGPLYESRDAGPLQGLLTIAEKRAKDNQFERDLLASPGWRRQVNLAGAKALQAAVADSIGFVGAR